MVETLPGEFTGELGVRETLPFLAGASVESSPSLLLVVEGLAVRRLESPAAVDILTVVSGSAAAVLPLSINTWDSLYPPITAAVCPFDKLYIHFVPSFFNIYDTCILLSTISQKSDPVLCGNVTFLKEIFNMSRVTCDKVLKYLLYKTKIKK
jgi:hypothetical protein